MTSSTWLKAKSARELKNLVASIYDSGLAIADTECERIFEIIDGAAPKKKKFVTLARSRAKTKKAERQDRWEALRREVLDRAGGVCEFCGRLNEALDCDHMFGRGGGRRALESKFTVWAICRYPCHTNKTANLDPERFLNAFIRHCECMQMAFGGSGYVRAVAMAREQLEAINTKRRLDLASAQIQGREK